MTIVRGPSESAAIGCGALPNPRSSSTASAAIRTRAGWFRRWPLRGGSRRRACRPRRQGRGCIRQRPTGRGTPSRGHTTADLWPRSRWRDPASRASMGPRSRDRGGWAARRVSARVHGRPVSRRRSVLTSGCEVAPNTFGFRRAPTRGAGRRAYAMPHVGARVPPASWSTQARGAFRRSTTTAVPSPCSSRAGETRR